MEPTTLSLPLRYRFSSAFDLQSHLSGDLCYAITGKPVYHHGTANASKRGQIQGLADGGDDRAGHYAPAVGT